jgi:hypothetical protein
MDRMGFLDSNEMHNACAFNFESLMLLERKLKFSILEPYSEAGIAVNGHQFLVSD